MSGLFRRFRYGYFRAKFASLLKRIASHRMHSSQSMPWQRTQSTRTAMVFCVCVCTLQFWSLRIDRMSATKFHRNQYRFNFGKIEFSTHNCQAKNFNATDMVFQFSRWIMWHDDACVCRCIAARSYLFAPPNVYWSIWMLHVCHSFQKWLRWSFCFVSF